MANIDAFLNIPAIRPHGKSKVIFSEKSRKGERKVIL